VAGGLVVGQDLVAIVASPTRFIGWTPVSVRGEQILIGVEVAFC
jgi:hypothetical protein